MSQLSFRQRVLVLAVVLVVAIQLVTLFPVLSTIKSDVDGRARESVSIGGAVFQEFMDNRTEQLRTTVSVLVSDFAFRQAVATGETETIRSALLNHSGRVGADMAVLLSLDGNVVGSSTTRPRLTEARDLADFIELSDLTETAHSVNYLDGVPYQTVTVPVRSPVPVGWVAMGFQIDDALAARIENLTGLEVSFVRSGGGRPEVLASTLTFDEHAYSLPRPGGPHFEAYRTVLLQTAGEDYLTLLRPFLPGADVYAALQLSMVEATASYRNVRSILLLITSLSLLLAVSGGFWLARTVTQPVRDLVTAARRMREGDYSEPIDSRGGDELGELAEAFNAMQEGIARREEHIAHQAHYHSLSGLPNRRLLLQRLGEVVRTQTPLAVLSLAIDRFDRIESSLGHRAGDEVVKLVARVLEGGLEDGQILGHPGGGNEFVILLPRFDNDQVAAWTERLERVLHAGVYVQGANLSLQASVGVARFPDHSSDPAELLRRAAMARGRASAERRPFSIYRLGEEERFLQQIRFVGDFPRAIRESELQLSFQPKIDCSTQEVRGAEALVRWRHPELGLLMPDKFVNAIEQAGSIGHLTRWVIREAARQCRAWGERGVEIGVAINLSVDDLVDEYLPYFLLEVVREEHLHPGSVTLEVTESAIMRNVSKALAVLQCIRDVGFRLAIDDFGTGQSSLAKLKSLPLDELKIDRSFVINLKDSKDEAIVRTTIELAHYLGLTVVAEGVETEGALRRLRSLGCEYAQGFYVSRPVESHAFCEWVRRWQQRERAQVVPLDEISSILES